MRRHAQHSAAEHVVWQWRHLRLFGRSFCRFRLCDLARGENGATGDKWLVISSSLTAPAGVGLMSSYLVSQASQREAIDRRLKTMRNLQRRVRAVCGELWNSAPTDGAVATCIVVM